MARYVALLRGINVGGNKRMPMADLRELLAGLGYTEVSTLLQSGNVVFTAAGRGSRSVPVVRHAIESAIEQRFGYPVRALLLTVQQLAEVVAANPLPVPDGSRLLVWFLDELADFDRARAMELAGFEPEQLAFGPAVIYVWCAIGILESRLSAALARHRFSQTATTRNWNTVTKLLALA